MMRAYIDESGHEGKGWMFLAGYLGNCEQWKKFADAWNIGLGPQRKSLHMTDLRWNQDRTKRLLERLGPIPEACGLTPILSGLRFGDYEDLISGTPAAKLLKGWLACHHPLVLQTLRVVPDDQRLELVFEEQREYQVYASMALAGDLAIPNHPWKRTREGKPKIAKWSFVPKGSTIMTDPADYLAFALREVWTDKNSKKSEWCRPILKSGQGIGKIYKRQEIRAAISSTLMLAAFRNITQRIDKLYARN
jgi:hypothetical protein